MLRSLRSAVAVVALAGLGHAASAQTVLLDFGRHNGNDGNATASPDVNGNYWNNLSQNGDFEIAAGYVASNLVDTDNNATAIDLTTLDIFRSNGRNNGGLLSPDAALLGDFAIGTATEDYWFVETGGNPQIPNATFVLSDLDPNMAYDLRMFGTRNTTDVRSVRYTATGGNGEMMVDLQTSGPDIGSDGAYDGNDDTIVSLLGVTPGMNNTITFDVDVLSGNFGYLGVMEITAVAVPEPASVATFAGIAGLGLLRRRRGGA